MSKRNDTDREGWVSNDEGLLDWYRRWRLTNIGGRRDFIRENRAEIDANIEAVLAGKRGILSRDLV